MRLLCACVFVLLCSAPSFAQSGITGQNYRQYVAGAASPIAGPTLLAAANIFCGQTPGAVRLWMALVRTW